MYENSEALKMSVMFYSAALLPCLRKCEFTTLQVIAAQLMTLSSEHPLHMMSADETLQASMLGVKCKGKADFKFTPRQILAAHVCVLWILCGEDEALCPSFCDSWYIREAAQMAGKEPTDNG